MESIAIGARTGEGSLLGGPLRRNRPLQPKLVPGIRWGKTNLGPKIEFPTKFFLLSSISCNDNELLEQGRMGWNSELVYAKNGLSTSQLWGKHINHWTILSPITSRRSISQCWKHKETKLTLFKLPGDVSDGVATSTQEKERQVVLFHEVDTLGVAWNKMKSS